MVKMFFGAPQPQQTKFKKDDRIIAVHDVDDWIKQGEIVYVDIPFLPCCGHMKLKNHDLHYSADHFELHPIKEGEELPANVQIGIAQEKVLFMIQDFVEMGFWRNQNGMISVNEIRERLQFHMNEMKIIDAYTNRG